MLHTHVATTGGSNSLSELKETVKLMTEEVSVVCTSYQSLTWFSPASINMMAVENTAKTFSLSKLHREGGDKIVAMAGLRTYP